MTLLRLAAVAVAAALLVVGVVALATGSSRAGVPFALVGAVLLAGSFVRRPARSATPEPDPFQDDDTPVLEEDVYVLRCASCGTVADVVDTGERPLRHVCPGCGAAGILPLAAARHAVPVPAARPGQRLKVRCGACRTVALVRDPGTRPLAHTCPACGRQGRLG